MLVDAMARACRAKQRAEKVLTLEELKKFVKSESVAEFCVELEWLTRGAYLNRMSAL